ncbi:hypothetical protein ACFQ9X_05450 [Catenulispora yoronensis]
MQAVTPPASPPQVPGVSAETDLHSTQPIGNEGVDVAVTDRITDCTAFGNFLAIRGGAATATLWLSYASPVAVVPTDQRFVTSTPSDAALEAFDPQSGRMSGFEDALLEQIAAACPNL